MLSLAIIAVDWPTMVGQRDDVGGITILQRIGVDEIGVQTEWSGLDAVEQRMIALLMQRIPAHMRNFQAGIAWMDERDIARHPAQPGER